jgi:hypothetical protein
MGQYQLGTILQNSNNATATNKSRQQQTLQGGQGQGQQPPIHLSNSTTIPMIVLRPQLESNISMDGSINETGTGTGSTKAGYLDQIVGTNASFDSQCNMELLTKELTTMMTSKKKTTSRAL